MKMATNEVVLQNLKSKADKADEIIAHLKAQIHEVKQTAATDACRREEVRLGIENTALRREVEQLKKRLIQIETKKGVVQVPLPTRSAAGTQPPTAPAVQNPVAANAAGASSNNKEAPPNKQQKKKEKKEGKPKQTAQAAPELPVDVSRLDMRIGFIVSAKKHPDADGLYVEDVDLGEERTRTIVSGLVKFVPLEQMQQRHAIFMCNLKPAKMRGILSEGMIMCGSTPEKVEIINPPEGAVKGDRITVEGYQGTPDVLLNPKKKIWEQVQPDLRISAEGVATYKGAAWHVGEKGICKAPTMKDTPIK